MMDRASVELPFSGRILPVVAIDDATSAEPLAEALIAGGCSVMEVTLRTPAAMDAIRRTAGRADLVVGAGTVLTVGQVEQAVDAGARFVVSPGLNDQVVERCRALGVPVLPGVATATELQRALTLGVDVVKIFPAEAIGGVKFLEALAAPFPEVRFVPTGGITVENLPRYLASPSVAAIGGTWMVARPLLASRDWTQVRTLTAAAVVASAPSPTDSRS